MISEAELPDIISPGTLIFVGSYTVGRLTHPDQPHLVNPRKLIVGPYEYGTTIDRSDGFYRVKAERRYIREAAYRAAIGTSSPSECAAS